MTWRLPPAFDPGAPQQPAAPAIDPAASVIGPPAPPEPALTTTPAEPPPLDAVHDAIGYWVDTPGAGPSWNKSVVREDTTTRIPLTPEDPQAETPPRGPQNAVVITSGDGTSVGLGSTETSGDRTTSDSVAATYGDGNVGVRVSLGETTTANGTSTTNADAATVTYGDGSLTTGYTNTQTTTTNGESQTVTRGITTAINAEDGTATIGGSTATNGNGYGGNIVIGPDGIDAATASATFRNGGLSGGGSLTIGENTVKLAGNARFGNIGIGATYTNVFGEVAQQVVEPTQADPVAGLLGGHGYLTTTRTDSTQLGGSLGLGPLGVAGDTSSSSSFQMIQQLPPSWETMTADERAAYQQQQQERLAGVGGIGDVDVAQLADGEGFRYTTTNGWNTSAGVSYGLVSGSIGGGEMSAHDVTLVRSGGVITVSMTRQDGETSTTGLAVGGVGLDVTQGSGDAQQFQFTVDPNDPEAMAEMQVFLDTGVLPGAQQIDDPEAQQAYTTAITAVDTVTGEIAQLEANMLQLDPMSPEYAQQQAELDTLYGDLSTAQAELTAGRNALNDLWMTEYGVEGDRTPMEGITITQETATHQESISGSVAGVEVGSNTQTWVDQAYVGTQGDSEMRFGYDQQSFLFGSLMQQQSAQADTAGDGIVLGMSSYNDVSYDGAQIIRNIQNSDVPDYVMDALIADGFDFHLDSRVYDHFAGRTTVAMTQEHLDGMSGYLNDMNNPESAAMWADFASRAGLYMGGGDFTLSTGEEWVDHRQREVQDTNRDVWLAGIAAEDPATSPLAAGLDSFAPGGTPEERMAAASAVFSSVQTPEQFQALTPEQQQLFIAVLGNTAGGEDMTGQRNSFDAMAAISLIEDDELRASQMRDLFADDNAEATEGGEMGDGVWNFVAYTERFRGDPALYNFIQQGIAFDWSQPGVEEAATHSPEHVQEQFAAAYTHSQYLGDHADGNGALQAVQAAQAQGGSAQVQQMLTATGADPQEMLRQLAHDPLRQHMMYDLLTSAGYDPALLAAAGLAFDPNT